jgi:hypothetical protein
MAPSRRPRAVRTIAAATAVSLFLLTSAACTRKDPPKLDQTTIDTITSRIEAELLARPEVTRADVQYQDNISASGSASVSMTVEAGSDYEPALDEAVRLIWESTLNPLHIISVDAIDAVDLKRGTVRYVDPDKEKQDLESKYGPHPR